MSLPDSEQFLVTLIESVRRFLDGNFGIGPSENTMFAAVDLLRSEPALRKMLSQRIVKCLKPFCEGTADVIPLELIELIAHELRWEEIREAAVHRANVMFGGLHLALGDDSERVVEAFSDDWDGRMFYRRYCPQA